MTLSWIGLIVGAVGIGCLVYVWWKIWSDPVE